MRRLAIITLSFLFSFALSADAVIHEINVGSFFFSPVGADPTVINHGDTVRWNFTGGFHTSTADGSSPVFWDSGLKSSGSWDRVFTAGDGPGPFPYHCQPHFFSMFDTIYIAPPAPDPQMFVFLIDQDQANAGAGTGSLAQGFAVFTLSADSTTLTMEIEHNVAGVTAAHLHNAPAGVDGGIAFGLASATSPISEVWALSLTDVTDLFAGDLYLNIHSGAFGGGEIRGQVVQDPISMMFTLDEARADAGAGSGSHHGGFVTATMQGDGSSFDMEIQHDIPTDSIIDAHLHVGPPGVSGAIVFGLSSVVSPMSESWSLGAGTESTILSILREDYYLNLHSLLNPAGDIRGQVARESVRWAIRLREAEADGGNGSGSTGSGIAVMEINDNYDELSIYAEHDLTDAIEGHIHVGGIGEIGAIVYGLASVVSPISETWSLSLADVNNLAAGNLYVNLHSTSFPLGDIRGQIDIEPINLTVVMDESHISTTGPCDGSGSPEIGFANLYWNAGGKHMSANAVHGISDGFIFNFHTGFDCVVGPTLHDFVSNALTLDYWDHWYISLADLILFMRGEIYVMIHSNSFFAGEIRGQVDTHLQETCCALAGDVNLSGGVDIADLTFTVNFMFKGGPAPLCNDNADVNASCGLDIADLTYRVNFMFKGGPDLLCGCIGS